MFGIKRRNLQIKRIKRKNLRITQIHLLKICWHPEPYVGEEVTLTLDKKGSFLILMFGSRLMLNKEAK
ncbi:hypothetical protein DNK57_06755 [Methanothermobacter thermautotrophicus]|uniref:Uncharacterized protein n=1 Tax=Methanothermobacter thermautotrophicus TaxID=145262 RepID=A0A842YQ50_METTF|nr:hypothetical protein [Methanothermobacter thermautotrophicus]